MRRATLVLGALLFAGSVAPAQVQDGPSEPTIVRVSPSIAPPGERVVLEIAGGGPEFWGMGYPSDFIVTFDGEKAEIQSVEKPLFFVVVPLALGSQSKKPTIYVRGAKGLARLEAPFEVVFPSSDKEEPTAALSRLQETLFSILQDPVAIFALIFPPLAIALVLAALWLRYRTRRGIGRSDATESEELRGIGSDAEAQGTEPVEERPFVVPQPEPSDELVETIVSREAVLFAGPGLSEHAGLTSWPRRLNDLIDDLEGAGLVDADFARVSRASIDRGDTGSVADLLARLGTGPRKALVARLRSQIDSGGLGAAPVHHWLAALPLAGVLTTNYDSFLEDAVVAANPTEPERGRPVGAEGALDRLSREEPFVFKLHGTLDDAGSVVLGVQEYLTAVQGNEALEELLDRVFLSRSILFLGMSLDQIEGALRAIRIRSKVPRRHFAIVPARDETWAIKAGALARYGVQVLPYSTGPDALEQFVEATAEAVRTRLRETAGRERASRSRGAALTRIELHNIGPFADLSLDLDSHWNLLLGDNGVGKSTVLKAIAVALCGDDAGDYAGRILRRTQPKGEITLHAGNQTYTTLLVARSGDSGVRVETMAGTALDREGWLAVGFPALRTLSWDRPRSEASLGARRPTTADLLPVVTDEVDPRLDGLKHRIAALDHQSKAAQLQGDATSSSTRLMSDFFDIVSEVTEGMEVRFKEVNPQTHEITVTTEDGDVPLESLSQGTISLVSWVGVLLQRLYEVTPPGEDPRERYVLVLIDEIDAHMHPTWQTSIVGRLSKIFPNAQFIATTHSPLVVRGLEVAQVVRFKRGEDGKVAIADVPDDTTMGRPDQVLAGALFDLDAGLDEMTEELIEDYRRLLGKTERTSEEEERFRELGEKLEFRIPVADTSPRDRRARELLEVLMLEQGGGQFPELRSRILERAQELFTEIDRASGDRE